MACQCHFHEVVGIIKVEKLGMELKCHYYDVTNVDVFNVFYHKKTMSDTETGFLSCSKWLENVLIFVIQVLERVYNVEMSYLNLLCVHA